MLLREGRPLLAATQFLSLLDLGFFAWLPRIARYPETKRRAKFYHITRTGRQQLEREQSSWSTFVEAVARVMGGKAS